LSEELLLEEAQPEDLSEIVALERASYSHPWSEDSLREAVTNERRYRTLVLRGAGDRRARAYCVGQHVADELHVHNVAVAEPLRRRGLARRLLERLLAEGRRAGLRVALLEVRESNHAARRLYQALGFEEVGHRRGYYASPVEDALLLRKALS
jgi:ribosomal-protein-alanine N-acetyltransferase